MTAPSGFGPTPTRPVTPYASGEGWTLYHGDCLSVMAALPEASVDSIVTDPPYGLGFMGREWDHGVPGVPFWEAALRVAKPGAHLVAFGGTRTFHRLTCAIEDAGWEIRDCLSYLYGSGFPKSHNGAWGGTALKPAWEPCILARKPLAGTVAANVSAHGTGALNIDGCRIGTESVKSSGAISAGWRETEGRKDQQAPRPSVSEGRWPANVLLDQQAGVLLDQQAGECGGSGAASGPTLREGNTSVARGAYNGLPEGVEPPFYGDSGGPSRFFYTAKASRSEREEGLENMAPARRSDGREKDIENPRLRTSARKNDHPTVKPLDLMRWLVRLVTPPGGIVLDPFMGSGTTLKAAREEFHPCIGIDMTERYCQIARGRLSANTLPLGVA